MAREAVFVLHNHQNGWAGSWAEAFAEGLNRHGWTCFRRNTYALADLVIVWGVGRQDVIERAKKDKRPVCVLERSYILDRFKWTSVSFGGGLNNRGRFRGPFEDGSRWEKHFGHLMQPWRPKPGGYALIMEQVPGDNSVRNVSLPEFYAKAEAAFRALGMPVKRRPHPHLTPKGGEAAKAAAYASIAEDLAGARCAVTWNSNSGVDAVLAGVPTVALDEGSMAWDVTGHELKEPPMPDRTKWAHALAWKQWTKEEIASGYCWDHVKGDL